MPCTAGMQDAGGKMAWTIIRPGGLKSDASTGAGVLTEDVRICGAINREDVAELVTKAVFSEKTNGKVRCLLQAQARAGPITIACTIRRLRVGPAAHCCLIAPRKSPSKGCSINQQEPSASSLHAPSSCTNPCSQDAAGARAQVLSAVDREQLYGSPDYKVFEL